jgi:NAD(P)-dependent dehydrogenase (short-subunit alcohol dehydrogenase family)
MNEKFLNDRVAVVSGGGRGIGRAIGIALAGVGCKLAFVDLDVAMAAESAQLASKSGGEAIALSCDVRQETQVKQVAVDVVERFGAVHILVNNAGTAIRKNLIDFTLDEWRSVVDTNVTGTFLMCKYLVPHMMGLGYGRIINLASVMGHVATAGRGAYAASKHAILGITKALALELVGEKITCVAISPGFVATDLTAGLRADSSRNEAVMAQTPMRRWAEPEEIASLALYLCSDGAAFMTGNDVLIDGGWSAQ